MTAAQTLLSTAGLIAMTVLVPSCGDKKSSLPQVQWIVESKHASLDPAVSGQVTRTRVLQPNEPTRIAVSEVHEFPTFVSVWRRESEDEDWLPCGSATLQDHEDVADLPERVWCESIPKARVHRRCVVHSVKSTGTTTGPGADELIPGARLVLSPHSHGAPAPHAPRGTTGRDGSVEFGPLVGEEWWADVSAPGHAPNRILITNLSDRTCDIYLFPSRTRRGRIRVDGHPPPAGTTVEMSVEAPGNTTASYLAYLMSEDGSFQVEEPINDVRFGYCVRLPGDCVVQFERRDGRIQPIAKSSMCDETEVTLSMVDVE